jgi:ATP-dependent RNA helicase RhlE
MNFESFNFHPTLMAGVRAMRYKTPTDIQAQALPPALAGRDIIGLARTGTGKTASFALPILQRLRSEDKEGIRALVICPTQELAEQTLEVLTRLGEQTGLEIMGIYDGVSMEKQLRTLRYRPAIIVACPGRLLDHLWKGTIKLMDLEVLVFDEADLMFDMGFLPEIRNILGYIEQRYQTLLFSATMPDGIRGLVKDYLHDPVTIQTDKILPAGSVAHALYPVQPHLKTELLKNFLSSTAVKSVLVFTRTKRRAARVARQLVNAGFQVSSLQGNLSRDRRQEAIPGFRDGSIQILIATDIASRGIDVLSISHIIECEMPGTNDTYTHPVAGTDRADNSGDAMTFVMPADEGRVQELEKLLEGPLERLTLPGFDYGRPAPKK